MRCPTVRRTVPPGTPGESRADWLGSAHCIGGGIAAGTWPTSCRAPGREALRQERCRALSLLRLLFHAEHDKAEVYLPRLDVGKPRRAEQLGQHCRVPP